MKSAFRSGATLVIVLLAVFPCGTGLTVLGTLVIKAVRIVGEGGPLLPILKLLWIPLLRASGGVIGFLSLIPGVDKLMVAEKRLSKRELIGIVVGICLATQFLISYLLHLSSLKLFRFFCVGPVVIEVILLLYHLYHFKATPRPALAPSEEVTQLKS